MKKLNIRTILLIAIVAVIGWIGITVVIDQIALSKFEGAEVKVHDAYQLDFVQMNKEDTHTMPVKAGDELVVSFAIEKGNVDLIISMGEQNLYRGNRIDRASFTLPIEADGDCKVNVKASQAKGQLSVTIKSK